MITRIGFKLNHNRIRLSVDSACCPENIETNTLNISNMPVSVIFKKDLYEDLGRDPSLRSG